LRGRGRNTPNKMSDQSIERRPNADSESGYNNGAMTRSW
jgi:hypothetical protein